MRTKPTGNRSLRLLPGQQRAMVKLLNFMNDDSARVFILKGYAGTGKTTLVREIIKALNRRNEHFRLLASTGRAAKILSNTTGESAITVHSCIYEYDGFNQNVEKIIEDRENGRPDSSGQLLICFSVQPCVGEEEFLSYYIIDESSMICDVKDLGATQAVFGSGRLLKDLLDYDPQGKFIFVGDSCQLPPVNQRISPALSESYFEDVFGIRAHSAELTEIVRQEHDNDIVQSSKRFRDLYRSPQITKWARFPMRGYRNIHVVQSQAELYNLYIENVRSKGLNDSVLIGFSNKQCNSVARIVRPSLGIGSQELSKDDLLLVTQNNVSGLMNGDLVQVVSVGVRESKAGLSFIRVSVKELFSGIEYTSLLIENVLYGNQTNLSQPDQKELFVDFFIRMKKLGIGRNDPEMNIMLREDPYLNALRCVFGYELTCHKSQGGEWNNVYLDLPRSIAIQPKPYVYQWMYTAMTRARNEVYVVDDFFLE